MKGEAADLAAIRAVHDRYLAMDRKDLNEHVRELWSADPDCVYFNYSGRTLRGVEQWLEYEGAVLPKLRFIRRWEPFEEVIRVHGDRGWITCSRIAEIEWLGEGESPIPTGPFLSRSTQIYHREPEGWRVVHAHFSPMCVDP
ncbi:MAG: nuclear transport factor 2 family protein, partial [Acidimicrobiia bacterium]